MDATAEAEAEADATSTSGECITPKKLLWRSASWSGFSSPTSSPTQNQKPRPNPKPKLDLVRPPRRPGRLALPLRPSLAGWPRQASDDSTSTPAGLADPDPADLSRVTDHVYLGSDSAARDLAALRRHGITHVLNCVGSACSEYFRGEGDLVYKTLWLHDSPGEDLASILYDAFDFLESSVVARPNGGRVLVHCVRGASRSAAVVVAYLMWRHALPFDAALRRVRAARPVADPNLGFAAQLLRRQQRALGLPSSPGSIRLVLRLAPHSPFAPMDLVPKSVLLINGEPKSFLDSRGSFLIHVPDAIYIWIGARCEPVMAAAAFKVARQVVRYERVLAPVFSFNEGSESDEFWAAVSDDLVVPDPSEVGKRRVDIYDLDFEIFQHALKSNSNDEPLESTTPSSSSADSTFSPASSSSSDWYNSPSTPDRPVFCQTPRVHLSTIKEKETDQIFPSSTQIGISKSKAGSLAERRGGITPVLNLSEQVEPEHEQIMMDWCPSPPFIPDLDEEEHGVDLEKEYPLDHSDESDKAEEDEAGEEEQINFNLIHPALYRWPQLDRIEEMHHDVLDSSSIFLMVAAVSRIGPRKSKGRVLYLWLGTDAKLVGSVEEERDHLAKSIGKEFVDRMGLPRNTPFEIIKEGQEPEQFLNHLFSFR